MEIMQLLINGISLGAVYAIIAVGYALVYSILRFSNFAQGGIIGLSAYIAYFFHASFENPPHIIVTILVACLSGTLLAMAVDTIGFVRVRKKNSPRIYYMLASITISMLIESAVTVKFGQETRGFPSVFEKTSFQIGGLILSTRDTVILIVSVILLIFLVLLINKTKIGRAIRCVAIDPTTAKLMGINSATIIRFTFMLAGCLAGVASVFLAMKYSVYPTLGSSMIFKGLVASVMGGLGSISGAIIGSFLLGILEMVLVYYLGSSITPAIVLGVMLVFLLVRPQGIAGTIAHDKA